MDKEVILNESDWNDVVMTLAIYGPSWKEDILEKLKSQGIFIPHWAIKVKSPIEKSALKYRGYY